MEMFIQVMESGNFTRAAEALGVPRSTVSTVIQSLEDRLGVQLLRRSTRRMVPSDEGERFLRVAREVVDAASDAEQMFRQRTSQLRGRLRIDMPSRIGRKLVIPALPTLLDEHPELSVEISTTDRFVNLISEGVDCVIRVGALESSDVICQKLGDVEIITCASPEYLAQYGTPKTERDLLAHKLVNYGPSFPASPSTFDYDVKGQTVEVPMANRVTVNNAEAYIAAALAGLGLIQIPAFDVRDLVKSGALRQVLPNLRPPPLQLSLLHARRRNVPLRISVFKEWVSQVLDRHDVFNGTVGQHSKDRSRV